MARRTAKALVVAEAPPAPVARLPGSPHEQARHTLAEAIATAVGRQDTLNSLAERQDHGETILAKAQDDEAGADRLVRAAKRQALFAGVDADWRQSAGIAEAQAVLTDAAERIELAREAIEGLAAERARIERDAAGDRARISNAISAVIRTSPRVAAIVAEATAKRRAWREVELVLDVLAGHFPGGLPGWDPVKIFDAPPRPSRDGEWLRAIEMLAVFPWTEFPP